MKFLYLLIDFSVILVPFIFSFHKKINFNREWVYFFPSNILVASFFIAWDIWFTKAGVWHFNDSYVTGIHFFNLPIEEVLFFIAIPYACVFTFHCFGLMFSNKTYDKVSYVISSILVCSLAVYGFLSIEKMYTSVTFLGLSTLIFFLQFVAKVKWLGRFYLSYVLLLIPFFIVNGILTGTGISEPVVSYNNNENLGIRILTIPVEDIFYGIFLLIANLSVYHFLNHRTQTISKKWAVL